MLAALLGDVKGVADNIFDRFWKGAKIASARTDPDDRLEARTFSHTGMMLEIA
jgi:hypothetical protein